MSSGSRVLVALVVLAGAAGAFFWWRGRQAPPPAPVTPSVAVAPAPAPPPPDAAPEPAVRHPLEPREKAPLPALADSDDYIKKALGDLFGRKGAAAFLFDGFARRFVATVDNLGRETAPPHMWPVAPTGGQLATEARGDGFVLAAGNAARYDAFVHLASAVEPARAVALYRRLYPLFQQAYEDLGYPGKYFNDRVIEVIDLLLATPSVAPPIKLRAVPSATGARPAHPLYQFEDAALEVLPAGQKILLRVGPEHARALQARLTEVRRLIARRP